MADSPEIRDRMALNARSRTLVEGVDRAGARSMLKAIGLTDEDLSKPIIGIANTWTEIGPCNFHLHEQAATGTSVAAEHHFVIHINFWVEYMRIRRLHRLFRDGAVRLIVLRRLTYLLFAFTTGDDAIHQH